MENLQLVKNSKELAKNLKFFRLKSDLTQDEVARMLNIDRSTYSYYETGKTIPSIFTAIELAKIFRIFFLDLFIKK